MRVLVTGTEGYIGSLLGPFLIEQGHEVLGLDTGFYKAGWLYNEMGITPRTLNKDIRHVTAADLAGMEAVVHLAELSNDPLGQLAPDITHDINHKGSVRLATLAKSAGVGRFVYMSSCSVYGLAADDYVDETSDVNPQTAYATCKTLVERDLRRMADKDFSPTFLRNATAFGASPRMRFDIVLNNLAGLAWTTGEVKMESDGTPWRPLAHVLDICRAVACTLEVSPEVVHNEVFNVGDTDGNYQVRTVAGLVAQAFEGCDLRFGKSNGADRRSYRVAFDKIHSRLPGFSCGWNAADGVEQLRNLFDHIQMSSDTFSFRGFTRLKQLAYLLESRQVDGNFFWRNPSRPAEEPPRTALTAAGAGPGRSAS
jgi:nucleoside-diphosphate-sugar epimerase